VIASSFDLWQSIIEEANCGLCVDPLDPLSVADAIDYLVDHPNEARQMGENGRRAVLSRYNWAQEEKKLLNFYDEIFSQ
jgi:glycosyltransferase involved in cell wall biosynthesis